VTDGTVSRKTSARNGIPTTIFRSFSSKRKRFKSALVQRTTPLPELPFRTNLVWVSRRLAFIRQS
jgi:hypothetical protein